MELPVETSRVFVRPKWRRFSLRVLQARQIGDTVLVIFDYMEFPIGRPAANHVAFDRKQQQVWVAQNVDEYGADSYLNFIEEEPLRVSNFSGYVCDLDPSTGRVVNMVPRK